MANHVDCGHGRGLGGVSILRRRSQCSPCTFFGKRHSYGLLHSMPLLRVLHRLVSLCVEWPPRPELRGGAVATIGFDVSVMLLEAIAHGKGLNAPDRQSKVFGEQGTQHWAQCSKFTARFVADAPGKTRFVPGIDSLQQSVGELATSRTIPRIEIETRVPRS